MLSPDPKTELSDIRSLMDRSTRFISLSGLSGVIAGAYALAGAGLARLLFKQTNAGAPFGITGETVMPLIYIAVGVLVLSVLTSTLLTVRKASVRGEGVWNAASKGLIGRVSVPLVSGGLLMIIFVIRGEYHNISPASLVFYGLALTAGSYYTVSLVKYLGYCEIFLGLAAALYPDYGLYAWIAGFGFLHIVYGLIMHFKYER